MSNLFPYTIFIENQKEKFFFLSKTKRFLNHTPYTIHHIPVQTFFMLHAQKKKKCTKIHEKKKKIIENKKSTTKTHFS